MSEVYKLIPLCGKYGEGKFALVDIEDFDECSKFIWYVSDNGYVRRMVGKNPIYLHRFIMKFPDSELDHKNRNKLDNRKSNLRLSTFEGNQRNKDKMKYRNKISDSKYIGIYFDKSRNKWLARATVNGKNKNLGRFNTEEEAARARDKVVKEEYGEFAVLNFPDG